VIFDLDDDRALEPGRAGAKAAWLARGRRAGLPILDGVVVPAGVSVPYLAEGAAALETSGSGRARLVVSATELSGELQAELDAAVARLPEPLVVRSSTLLEADGAWSGAFTSYLEVFHAEVAKTVAGCWASSFTVSTLQRFAAAGVDPGSAPMAVLVQQALSPEFGGAARLRDDMVEVTGVVGSPSGLLSGWDPGVQARVVASGVVQGDEAADLLGTEAITSVAAVLREAHAELGADECEWAWSDGEVVVLQLGRSPSPRPTTLVVPSVGSEAAIGLARLVRRYPGVMGERLVLPWAVADPTAHLDPVEPIAADPAEALAEAIGHAEVLIAEVWAMPKAVAATAAREALRGLRGTAPDLVIEGLAALRIPDPERSRLVLGLLGGVRDALVRAGAVSHPRVAWHVDPGRARRVFETGEEPDRLDRIGFGRWEPFDAAVVMASGSRAPGTPASPGMACGRLCYVADASGMSSFLARDVVVAPRPLPNLAALLWDAAGLVTLGGGPGAHLFSSARALGIPAVCGVELGDTLGGERGNVVGTLSIAVDGHDGAVYAAPW
jgi:hypothetical protein